MLATGASISLNPHMNDNRLSQDNHKAIVSKVCVRHHMIGRCAFVELHMAADIGKANEPQPRLKGARPVIAERL